MATAKAKTYTVTKRDGSTKNIEADSYEQDGSGVRFKNADGSLKASYGDGVIVQVEEA